MIRPNNQLAKRVAGRDDQMTGQGEPPAKMLVAMTGKASAAKTA